MPVSSEWQGNLAGLGFLYLGSPAIRQLRAGALVAAARAVPCSCVTRKTVHAEELSAADHAERAPVLGLAVGEHGDQALASRSA